MDETPKVLLAAVFLATVVVVVVLTRYWDRWRTQRAVDRWLRELLSRTKIVDGRLVRLEEGDATKLKPESDYIVTVSEETATCLCPDGKSESVRWDDLQKVAFLTTDEGPFVPDMFWILYGSQGGCMVPSGATGEQELQDRLFALPGFRSEDFIHAASLTTNNLFVCWERPA